MTKEWKSISCNLSKALLELAKESDPQEFAIFIGASMANLVGNMPEKYWKEFITVEPCNVPGCDCHLIFKPLLKALEKIRKDHMAVITGREKAKRN